MQPILLPANQPPDRFYTGGPLISTFRRTPTEAETLAAPPTYTRKSSLSHRLKLPLPSSTTTTPSPKPRIPEDWVGSTTCCRGGPPSLGLTRLPSTGEYLKDAISRDPTSWLGPTHVSKYGADTKLLVKLLDAGQRLPVHAHPHVSWATAHVPGARHGKAEAWYILTRGIVYLGLKRDVSPEEMRTLIETQDTETLLGLTHAVPVDPHETVYIPPGLFHAIGEGILLAEVQEPEDLSILAEWKGFEIDGAKEGHLGVGWEEALRAVELKGRNTEEVCKLVSGGKRVGGDVLVGDAGEYFRLEALTVDTESGGVEDGGTGELVCEAGFAVVLVLYGDVELVTSTTQGQGGNGDVVKAPAGSTLVVPFAAGEVVLRGQGRVLFARPPKV